MHQCHRGVRIFWLLARTHVSMTTCTHSHTCIHTTHAHAASLTRTKKSFFIRQSALGRTGGSIFALRTELAMFWPVTFRTTVRSLENPSACALRTRRIPHFTHRTPCVPDHCWPALSAKEWKVWCTEGMRPAKRARPFQSKPTRAAGGRRGATGNHGCKALSTV